MKEERDHALLSASSAKKWLNCPPSARLEDLFLDESSKAADEGSLAHSISELKLRKTFVEVAMTDRSYKAKLNKLKKETLYQDEMERYTDAYVDYVSKIAYSFPTSPYVAIEKKIDYSNIAPEGFGTADCVILYGSECHVIDFKYGKGVPVKAEANPQLALYALGVLLAYKAFYPIDKITLHIVQPRLDNFSSWVTNAAELTTWSEIVVKPAALLAFEGKGEFKQGTWCDDCFCRAAATCKHRADTNMELLKYEGAEPPKLLSNLAVGEILEKAQFLAKWVKKLENYALDQLVKGNEIYGWKIVEGRSNRVIQDIDAAFEALVTAGYDKALLYENKPLALTAVEQLISKEDYESVLSKYIAKPQGSPTLALYGDKRPEMKLKTTAAEDFGGDNQYKEE
ncbi:MAG: hypothetical protein K0R92_378 [Lachnospiraceae bacterium]|jgi:hypothetical protein|nr:hypothetical protein [Lachnospiraceae bacterium]